jgi:hypothetical protein
MKDENRSQWLVDLFPPSLWGLTILHQKAKLVNTEILLVITHISLAPSFSGRHRSMNTVYRVATRRLMG